jgi:molecular chaperone DnaK
MVAEAQQHSGEDKRRREEIDARNELDSLAYRAEQIVDQLQAQLPVHDKARAEQLIADARQAVADDAGLDRVRPLSADVQQIIHALPNAAAARGTDAEAAANGSAEARSAADTEDEEVVDAEFTRD